MPDHDISIRVGGDELREWLSYEIESDLLQPADAFSITFANPAGRLSGRYEPCDPVQVYVDGTLQMTGYVDAITVDVDAQQGAALTVTGRDRFGQLVDVSAEPKTYSNVTLLQLAEAVSDPFVSDWLVDNEKNRAAMLQAKQAIASLQRHRAAFEAKYETVDNFVTQYKDRQLASRETKAKANLAKIKASVFFKAKVEPGDTPYEVISRHAQKAGLLVWQAADGAGVIAAPSYDQPPLYSLHLGQGESAARNNAKRASVTKDARSRYATYRMQGTSGNTSDNHSGSSRHKAEAYDAQIPLERTQILTEDVSSIAEAQSRATREMQQRRFEGLELQYTTKGHSNSGALWQVDTLCRVNDALSAIEGNYYVTRRRFSGGPGGQVTDVTLHESGVLGA